MKVVVFDLDDTLYKERDYVLSGCRAVATVIGNRYGIETYKLLQIIENAANVSEGFDRLISFVNSGLTTQVSGIDQPLGIADILGIYRNHNPQIVLSEESRHTLEWLHNQRFALGIITDGRSIAQRAKIGALGLDKYCQSENIIISEEIGADKHLSVGFQRIMDNFRAAEEATVISTSGPLESLRSENPHRNLDFFYIGDNPRKDFYWPNKLGWRSIQLLDPRGVNIHQPVKGVPAEFRPQMTINNLTELIDFFS